jgi:hypothetical protein
MTIPNTPPEVPPDEPIDEPPSPDGPPEYPGIDQPDWKAPGTPEDYDAPMRLPRDNPDVETEL